MHSLDSFNMQEVLAYRRDIAWYLTFPSQTQYLHTSTATLNLHTQHQLENHPNHRDKRSERIKAQHTQCCTSGLISLTARWATMTESRCEPAGGRTVTRSAHGAFSTSCSLLGSRKLHLGDYRSVPKPSELPI